MVKNRGVRPRFAISPEGPSTRSCIGKIMFDRYYCINSTKHLLLFWKNMALYFVIVVHYTNECLFYLNIGLPDPRAPSDL